MKVPAQHPSPGRQHRVLSHTPKVVEYRIHTRWRGSGTIWHCPLHLPCGKQGSVSSWPQPGAEEGLWVEEPRSGRGPHTPFPGSTVSSVYSTLSHLGNMTHWAKILLDLFRLQQAN